MRKWIRIILTCLPKALGCYNRAKRYLRKAKKGAEVNLKNQLLDVSTTGKKLSDGGLRIRYVISGEENIVKGQKVYIGNHVSAADPVMIFSSNSEYMTMVAKKEIETMPLIGPIAKSMDCVFLDRGNLRAEVKSFMQIDKLLVKEKDVSLLVFPEGTRSKEENLPLLPFHPGTFKIATKREIPIVPFVICGSEKVLSSSYHFKVYPVQIKYLKPLMPSEYENMNNQEIADLMHDRIQEALKEVRSKEQELIKQFNNYSDKKMKKIFKN